MALDPNAAAAPGSGVFGLFDRPKDSRVVLLPVPFEATTSYGGGTAGGPEAILAASRQVELYDIETGKPYEAGIAWLPVPGEVDAWNREGIERARPVVAAGGVDPEREELVASAARVDALCEKTNLAVQAEVTRWIKSGATVGTVGGDHSIAFGAIAAAAEANPRMGILHLDAHADLRQAFEGFAWSHASIMENVMRRLPKVGKLVQVGIRDLCEEEHERIQDSRGRIVTHFDTALSDATLLGTPFSELCAAICDDLPERVYLSFDIDGLDPALCPHTGTPVPGGLSFQQVNFLLRALVSGGKRIVGFDLTEVSPGPEGDEWDANVGARLLYKMIGWTLKSQE
jgi:agmatinase